VLQVDGWMDGFDYLFLLVVEPDYIPDSMDC
jgi:hypothetical protein